MQFYSPTALQPRANRLVIYKAINIPCESGCRLLSEGQLGVVAVRHPSLDLLRIALPRCSSGIVEMPPLTSTEKDVAFVSYFRSLEHSRTLRTHLHETLRKGWFDLARARFHSGRFSQIGSDMIVAKELEPSFTLERIGPEPDSGWCLRDVGDNVSVLNDSAPDTNNVNTLRSRTKKTTNGTVVKRGQSGKTTATHVYFGGRSSKALAEAREEFFKAVQLLCEMANIDLQMRTFANTIGEPESESEQEVSENENDDE